MRNPIIALSIGAVLAGCTSAEQKQDYRDAQVQVIGAQVSGRTEQDKANASARAALYQAMAEVAKNAPDSADAIAVAWQWRRFKRKRIPLEQLFSFIESKMKL